MTNNSSPILLKYGRNDKLYPKLPKERALVDQRLYFDLGVFYAAFSDYYVKFYVYKMKKKLQFLIKILLDQYPVMFRGATSLDASKKKPLDNALGFFNMFVSEHDYAAGDHMTIADLSLLASASTMEVRISINNSTTVGQVHKIIFYPV